MIKVFLLCFAVILVGCNVKDSRAFIPYADGYDESKAEIRILPKQLEEISGLNYLADGRMAAINDEEGEIFIYDFRTDSLSAESIVFEKKGDYEEIVKVGNTYWVMESNGDLYEVTGPGQVVKYKSTGIKKTEFESMYMDSAHNRLVLISKDHKEVDRAMLAYEFNLSSKQFNTTPIYEIMMQDVHFHLKNSSAQCKPSGAAVHPITGNVYLVASVGKVLLEVTTAGKVVKAYHINPVKFQQPEGITFAPNGDMYISNEAAQGKATIIKFPYTASQADE